MALRQDLYELIQSLNHGDLTIIGSSNALSDQKEKLFQVLKKMKPYDQATLSKAFPTLTPSHLAVLKKQLYSQLLELFATTSPERTFQGSRFSEIDFLARHGLLLQAYTHTVRSLEEATNLEAFDAIGKLIRLKHEFEESLKGIVEIHDNRQVDLVKQKNALEGIIEVNHLQAFYDEAYLLKQLIGDQRVEFLQDLNDRLPLFESLCSSRGQILWHKVNHRLARYQGDLLNTEKSAKAIVNIIMANRDLLIAADLREQFFISTHSMIVCKIDSLRLKEAEKDLAKYRLVAQSIGVLDRNNFNFRARIFHIELLLALYNGKEELGLKIVNQLIELFEPEANAIKLKVFAQVIRVSMFFCFIFQRTDLVKRLYHLYSRLDTFAIASKEQYITVQFFNLLALLQEQQFDALEVAHKKSKALLRQANCKGIYEQRLNNFFESVCENSLPENILKQADRLYKDLTELFKDSAYWIYRDTFPLLDWIESIRSHNSLPALYSKKLHAKKS